MNCSLRSFADVRPQKCESASRFDEIVAGFLQRGGSDDQTPLPADGRVTLKRMADPEEWRRETRRQARRDLVLAGGVGP